MNNEIQTSQTQQPAQAIADGGKEKFNFIKWVRGKNRQELLENSSYVAMVIAAVLVSGGLLVGSFVPGVVIIASIGAFMLLPALVVYVISQLMLPDNNPEEDKN